VSVIDTLVTDRKETDVQAVKNLNAVDMSTWTAEEVTAYLSGLKGAYNATDLNRVGEACDYLFNVMRDMGYEVAGYVSLKTDWTFSDIPTQAQMETYLSTIRTLKSVWGAAQSIPETMNRLGYEGANNIEKLLKEIDDISSKVQAISIKSGAWNAFSGTGIYIKEGE
jgi:hypothetical protein